MAAGDATSSSHVAEEQQQRDWAWGLPSLAVGTIAERLLVVDFVNMCAVCKAWSAVLRKQHHYLPAPQVPWLMVPTEDTPVGAPKRRFLCLADRRSYDLTVPELAGKHVITSDKGWLVLSDSQWNLSLLQPFTGAHLSLPSVFTIPEFKAERDPSSGLVVEFYYHYSFSDTDSGPFTIEEGQFIFIQKIALSSNTSEDKDCVAVLLVEQEHIYFANARLRDSSWTSVNIMFHEKVFIPDILFVDCHCLLAFTEGDHPEVISIDFSKKEPHFTLSEIKPFRFTGSSYFAKCANDLFVLLRQSDKISDPRTNETKEVNITQSVELYKLVANEDDEFIPVKTSDLNGHSLFVGANNCICLKASDVHGLQENFVYFTDEYENSCLHQQCIRDVVVLDLKKGGYEFCYPPESYLTYPPPIWFIPSLI